MKEKEFEYQFTAIPTNLMACMDLNCRSMLFTLIQLSSYYAKDDGWFYRRNEDLCAESLLSENVARATLSTLHNIGIVDVKVVDVKKIGHHKGKKANEFRLNIPKIREWDKYSLEDCIKHPNLSIETDNYKAKGWHPSYIVKRSDNIASSTTELPILSPTLSQSEHNIENINNKENKNLYEGSKQVEVKSNQFEEYKKREDYLMDKLYHISTWIDFKTYCKQIEELISTAQTEKVAEKTRARYKKIEKGKIKFLKAKISKEPYNSHYNDFYREYNCGWLGKEKTEKRQIIDQSQDDEEEERKAEMRSFFIRMGTEIPDEYKKPKASTDKYAIKVPIPNGDSNDDDLPF